MRNLRKTDTEAPKRAARDKLEEKTTELHEQLLNLQYGLYKLKEQSVLIVLQGLDAAGKDSTIRSVFSGVNPQGTFVKSWKVPTEEEFSHDFLWRIHEHVPPKGMIHIFNRSHYEDVIVPQINKSLSSRRINQRYDFINNFEKLLKEENNTIIFKFFLHISQKKQREKLEERIYNPEKRWKHNPKDMEVNLKWNEYIKVYEKILDKTEKVFPWHIVPADNKWYRNYVIANTLVKELKKHIKL